MHIASLWRMPWIRGKQEMCAIYTNRNVNN